MDLEGNRGPPRGASRPASGRSHQRNGSDNARTRSITVSLAKAASGPSPDPGSRRRTHVRSWSPNKRRRETWRQLPIGCRGCHSAVTSLNMVEDGRAASGCSVVCRTAGGRGLRGRRRRVLATRCGPKTCSTAIRRLRVRRPGRHPLLEKPGRVGEPGRPRGGWPGGSRSRGQRRPEGRWVSVTTPARREAGGSIWARLPRWPPHSTPIARGRGRLGADRRPAPGQAGPA